jgi:hypothetical protein
VHAIAQAPAAHDGVPFVASQALAQAPQLAASTARFVSQPLAGSPSQSPKPALQLGLQAPALHVVDPFGLTHALPQAPQFAALVAKLTSQPLAAFKSQSPKPLVHAVMAQALA